MSDDGEIKWKGPSNVTKWLGPLETHLGDGGYVDLRYFEGLAARVACEDGLLPPRTGEARVLLKVSLRHATPHSTLNAFEQAITTQSSVFMTRSDAAHDDLPTAYQYIYDSSFDP